MAQVKLPRLLPGIFLSRPNRFLARVKLRDGSEVEAFLCDPGRLEELLLPGAEVFLAPVNKEGRRTSHDLRLVKTGGTMVSIDSRVPNNLMGAALRKGEIPSFRDYGDVLPEPRVPGGRLDFLLRAPGLVDCYIEVKSCTLVIAGKALFPDAPTARGARHLKELLRLKTSGCRAAIIFLIQRQDAVAHSPNDSMDPDFGLALRNAEKAGVEIHAYRCRVSTTGIALAEKVPVIL